MASGRRFYEELRKEVEERRGSMYFVRSGSRWGAWEIRLEGRIRRFESNGRGFPELDRLYVPKVENPRHWKHYSNSLIPGALDQLLKMLLE